MGMFSTLPHLIDAPMEEILAELPVADEVKEALLTGTGPGGALYRLTQAYEGADWERVSFLAHRLGIVPNLLTTLHFECMERADRSGKTSTR